MNVEITNADGSTLNPVYSPEHKDSVIAFYQELVNNHKAMSVRITMDNGEVFHFVEA